jgi:ribosomal protein S18 acetylase RimI-like enzyme
MEISTLHHPGDKDISAVTDLHIKYLSYRSFVTKFGNAFLSALYKDWIAAGNAILIVAKENSAVKGFVLGIKNNGLLFDPIKKKPFKYAGYVILGLLKNPFRIKKVVETLLYNKKSVAESEAELLVIITDGDVQSKGIGSELVRQLDKEFLKDNIHEYVVTVHSEMKGSNNFYMKNRMTLERSFMFYSTEWNLYKKKITS